MGCSITERRALKNTINDKIKELEELQTQGYESYTEQGEEIESLAGTIEELRQVLMEMDANPPTNANILMDKLNGVLRVKFNGVSKPRDEAIKDIRIAIDNATTIQTDRGTYTFVQGQDRSTNFGNRNVHVVVDGLGALTNQYKSEEEEINDVTDYLMAKSGTKISKTDKYRELEADIHANPEKMVELLDKLNEVDATQETDEHMKHLRELIGSLNPKFMKRAKTFIMENAIENGGMVVGKDVKIMIGKSERIARNQQSAAEVYAHEVIHTYTKFAVELAKSGDVEARKILRELQYVMKVSMANTTWKDFLPNKKEYSAEEEKEAKERYDYIFDVNSQGKKDWKPHNDSEHEFMAHALTNPYMVKKLKHLKLKDSVANVTLWDKVKNLFNTIVSVLSGDFRFKDRTKNLHELTLELVGMFAEHNNKGVKELKKKESVLNKLTDMFDDVEQGVVSKVHEAMLKVFPKNKLIGPPPENKAAKAVWLAKAVITMATSEEGRKQLFGILRVAGLPLYGTVASVLRDFVESSELEKTIDWLALQADKIDQTKMNVIGAVKDGIRSEFKKKLTAMEEEQLTLVILDTDLQSISKDYSNVEMREMLEDEDKLRTEIGRVKHKLKELDPENYNWNTTQASGLGYYLATGKGHIAQNINAENIAKGKLSNKYRKGWIHKKGDLEKLIDTVATLTALENTEPKAKLAVAALMKDERKGVGAILDTARFLHDEARDTVFADQTSFMVKGYSKELFDSSVTMEVVEVEKHDEMIKNGFKKVKDISGHSGVYTQKQYAMYVSNSFETNEWHRAATRLTKMHTKGTSMKELYYAENDSLTSTKHIINKLHLDKKRLEIVDKINKGKFDKDSVEYGLMPSTDEYGEVVDYRYMMEKGVKKDIFKQDTKVTMVLGATRGNLLDKQLTGEHNKKILKVITTDAKENYIDGFTNGKNGIAYVVLKDKSGDPMIQDLWDVLPKEFKQAAYRNTYKGLAIREDMLVNYFGYRHLSIANVKWIKAITPGFLHNIIKIAEAIWIEFIKISKIDILIKMPFVMVGNLLSNAVYAVTTGSSPIEVIRMYKESITDVRNYLTQHRELVKLQEKNNIGKATKKELDRIVVLQHNLKINPIHELYELGIYQAIVEDVSQEELSSSNKLKKVYNEKMEKVPKVIKDGLNWIYLTEETQYYKFMTEVLQMSDLVARDVENRKMKKIQELQANGTKKLPMWYIKHLEDSKDNMAVGMRIKHDISNRGRKMSGEERKYFKELAVEYRKNYVLNAFVNYNKPSGSLEEYLNKIGFVMFTKYAKRIQRVIANTATNYPIRTLLTAFIDGYLVDLDTIQGQSVFTRSWYNMTPQWPVERIMDVFTPPIIQASTYRII